MVFISQGLQMRKLQLPEIQCLGPRLSQRSGSTSQLSHGALAPKLLFFLYHLSEGQIFLED